MDHKGYYLPQDIYTEHLKIINGIHFTRREIDIISFLIRGRTAKKIAALLSIAPKTVENHTRNIMIKLQCNSRENIIDFIEKSRKFSFFKDYCTTLLIALAFEKSLISIATIKERENPSCAIVYWTSQTFTSTLAHLLEIHLKLAGVKTSLEARDKVQPFSELIQEARQTFKIYVLPDRKLSTPESKRDLEKPEAPQSDQKAPLSLDDCLILLPADEESPEIPKEIEGFHYVDSAKHENYYLFVFEIFDKLFPTINFEEIIFEFKKTSHSLMAMSEPMHPQPLHILNNQKSEAIWEIRGLRKSIGLLTLAAFLCLGLLAFGGLKNRIKQDKAENQHQDQSQNLKNQHFSPIRSDLVIPSASTFLDRPQLVAQIEGKFRNKKEGTQIVALVGIGGSGKTTLARQYARVQKSSLVWEINLATQESFMGSLENLAYALSKTEIEKKILRGIQDIKSSQERENKITEYIKDRIKHYPNWFVIFDNLESVSNIQKFFPSDSKVLGNGKIIVTTRDSNIENSDRIDGVVQIGELNQTKKFSLFVKIFNNGIKELSPQQNKETLDFLSKIPPFPLDISVAATYLKATHISFKGYLEHLRDCNQNFIDTQENVLREGGRYAKTRYSIITLSLKQLIEANKDFSDLLVFVSLLDSQEIPRNLLGRYKSNIIVDNFVYNLKKYSLITDSSPSDSSSSSVPIFSIHQSTQEICLAHLSKTLNLDKNNKIITDIFNILKNYIHEVSIQQNFDHMRILANHCKKFLSHSKYLSDNVIETIQGELGHLYKQLGDDQKAIQLLNKSIMSLTQAYRDNHPLIPLFLNYLGDIYFDLGNYGKSRDSYKNSIQIYRQYFPKNYAGVADSLSGLALVYRSLGEHKAAKDLLEESLMIYKKCFLDNHPKIAWTLKHLGYSYRKLGDHEKAKDFLEKSLALFKKNHPQDNDETNTWIQVGLGNLHRELGNYPKAKELLEQSLMIYEKNLPENHYKIAQVLRYLGILYREWGDYQGAKEFLKKSIKSYEVRYPENQYDIVQGLKYLGTVYRRLGDYEKSRKSLERSLAIQKSLSGTDNIEVYSIYINLGNLDADTGAYEQAKKILEECLRVYENYYGKNHLKYARVLRYLGRAYFKAGNLKSAEKILSKSLIIFQPSGHPHTYRVLEDLGTLYQNLSLREKQSGNEENFEDYRKKALDYMMQALETTEKYFPQGAPHITRVQSKLKAIENRELKLMNVD